MKQYTVLFENDEILLVHKEYGVCVQGGKTVTHSLDEDLCLQLGYKIYLVHRLDRDTDGILLVAKNPKAAAKWTSLIGSKSVKKEYWAWCADIPLINGSKKNKGVISSVIEQHKKTVSAQLSYEVVLKKELLLLDKNDQSKNEVLNAYLIHIVLGTGRLHQIRIQMASSGAPLLQDDQHGNFKLNKKLRKLGIKKLQLCAKRLTIPMGTSEKTFEIDFPEHFIKAD